MLVELIPFGYQTTEIVELMMSFVGEKNPSSGDGGFKKYHQQRFLNTKRLPLIFLLLKNEEN